MEKYEKVGKVCGCPFASIGSELSTQDEQIRKKAHELSERTMKYLACTLRDAAAEGILETKDPVELARQIFCYAGGLIMQAKIENNPDVLKCLEERRFPACGREPARVGRLRRIRKIFLHQNLTNRSDKLIPIYEYQEGFSK